MGEFHDKKFPGESDAYRAARDRLLSAEIDLRQRIEDVAALRRALPTGGVLSQDYVFDETDASGALTHTRFSELFAPQKDTLLLYHFMYGPDWDKPCPMCTSIVDGWNGNAAYVAERANVAFVSSAAPEKFRVWGEERGWRRLRLLSSRNNTFSKDYNSEFESSYGDQHPVLHVFRRQQGQISHFWSSELLYAKVEGQARHVDLTWPLWNLLDLTPEGRGTDWYPAFQR